jgi:hypothetical protein
LSDSLDGLRKTLTVVTDEQEFLSLANAARLYSLSAFLELDRLSQTTNAFAKDAKQIVWALRRDMEIDRQSLTEYVPIEFFDGKYTYNGPFTSEEIALRLRIPQGVEGGANLARKEGLKYFIPQLVTMAQSENNLWVANRITHAISVLSGRECFPWTLDSLKTWWEGSSAQFTNWPYASFDKALIRFNARQYFGARLEFESIINSDPYADQSRALAIICAIETGDTNKIATLATNWKYPDGRWASFSKAKMNLSTGDVTQATIQLAEFAAKYRTLENWIAIRPGVHYLRQVDWPLYEQKLTELLKQNK